ncbi:SRPBCC family protein [Chitiniphilus eburneus]|uniref:SRPBCC domain-containing protein n=1 Tax=Chitiniphilus eburneus TaxID=2571148 RepID=A0A4U0Q504_9NEIS|nr:SRPBCC domain-containing protein [Chitiniphilus eburneus]TJZ76227.1 SRPBCC domain-containing protein [Chitiniphilus eburneus]
MNTDSDFVITRLLDAPRALVWQVHSDPAHLARWWGPKGCAIDVAKLDFTPGGLFHYAMRWQEQPPIWGRFVYREIEAPRHMVYVNSFADAQGGIVRNPWSATWPLEMLTTLTLEEEGAQTRLTIRSSPLTADEEEIRTFVAGHKSMEQGFSGTIEQLSDYLASLPRGA